MQVIEIEGVGHPVACNALTPIVYSGAFSVEGKNGRRRPKDVADGLAAIGASIADTGAPPMAALLEFFWAFEKTADAKTAGFDAWVRRLPASVLDMARSDGWATDVVAIVEANFFPGAGAGVEAEAAEAAAASDA